MDNDKIKEQKDKKPKLTRDGLKKAMSLFAYVLPYKWPFIIGMVLLSTGSLIFLAIMKIPGEILNIISGESNYGLTLEKLFGLLVLLLVI